MADVRALIVGPHKHDVADLRQGGSVLLQQAENPCPSGRAVLSTRIGAAAAAEAARVGWMDVSVHGWVSVGVCYVSGGCDCERGVCGPWCA